MKSEHAISKPSDTLRGQFAVWSELAKLRLTTMVLITTAMGFYLASASAFDWMMLLHALFGTGLLACGAAALNQYLEKEFDAKMPRTANRPIPAGHPTFFCGVMKRSPIRLSSLGWIACSRATSGLAWAANGLCRMSHGSR